MHSAEFLARPQYSRYASGRKLAKSLAQPRCKSTIELLRIGHGNDRVAIGVCRLKTFNTKEMYPHILKGYDGVRIRANLSVGSLESKCLVESDRFVEVAAWETRINAFVRHKS